jgi:predicted Zn-dependent peptidase
MLFNKIESLDEINQKINAIAAEEILEVANEILDTKQLSMLVYE